MKTEEQIREQVRERYTAAISIPSGCCGPSSASGCCGSSSNLIPAERVACSAGYSEAELQSLPQDAVVNSFGCGNPLAFSEVKAGQTVVDIGSGAGIDCLLAAQKVGSSGRVIGVDMTPVMIEKARTNALKAGAENVEFRLGEAEHMPLADHEADWIISNCVINLSPNKPAVFHEAFRALRSGGRLSVSDIMVEKLPPTLRESTALYTSCVAGAIPEREYLEGLQRAGFEDVQVTERIVYDRDQIFGLLKELEFALDESLTTLVDRSVAGNIWSARVTARKP
ncbi:arsenite methyltransferase [bacterium]|nr:arsenite methyltransferase [bacterium]